MRIWDVPPDILCRQHLLGEHRELHALWTILSKDKKGYRNHPETKRWVNKLPALAIRHEVLVKEMEKRGYRHHSPLDAKGMVGKNQQDSFLDTINEQFTILKNKPCPCPLDKPSP